jgi:hypothetical protein
MAYVSFFDLGDLFGKDPEAAESKPKAAQKP